jgi:putative endonuclease
VNSKLNSGKEAEGLAAAYLKKRGFKIIEKNYRTKLGEIDIIGKDKDCICFIEVRSRNTDNFGTPEDSITRRKQNRIMKAALFYIKKHGLEDADCRFDVVCVVKSKGGAPGIDLIKNAFELDTWYRY